MNFETILHFFVLLRNKPQLAADRQTRSHHLCSARCCELEYLQNEKGDNCSLSFMSSLLSVRQMSHVFHHCSGLSEEAEFNESNLGFELLCLICRINHKIDLKLDFLLMEFFLLIFFTHICSTDTFSQTIYSWKQLSSKKLQNLQKNNLQMYSNY